MKTKWSLNSLYQGLDDPKYEADFAAVEVVLSKMRETIAAIPLIDETNRAETILKCLEQINEAVSPLAIYLNLRLAVDSDNSELMGQMNRLMMLTTEYASDEISAIRMLGEISDIDVVCEGSRLASEYRVFIMEQIKGRKHLLGDEAESVIAAMNITGGGAWGEMHSFMTSTVSVEFGGELLPLSSIRNLAFDENPEIRKKAYDAELACYENIKDPIAFALNNIKNQVSMLCSRRGFRSPLDMTLEQTKIIESSFLRESGFKN